MNNAKLEWAVLSLFLFQRECHTPGHNASRLFRRPPEVKNIPQQGIGFSPLVRHCPPEDINQTFLHSSRDSKRESTAPYFSLSSSSSSRGTDVGLCSLFSSPYLDVSPLRMMKHGSSSSGQLLRAIQLSTLTIYERPLFLRSIFTTKDLSFLTPPDTPC